MNLFLFFKVAEAVLMGVPIVGTPIAFESMNFEDNKSVFFGRTVNEFVGKMYLLLTDEKVWYKLKYNSWRSLVQFYSIQNAREQLEEVLSVVIPSAELYDFNPVCENNYDI